jgi:hypothetical protein
MRDEVGDGPERTQDITSIQAFYHDTNGFYTRTTFAAAPRDDERVNLIVEYGKRVGTECVGDTRMVTATAGDHADAKLTYSGGAGTAPAIGTTSADGLVVRLRAAKPADLTATNFGCVNVYLRPLDETDTVVDLDVAGPLFLNPEHKPCRKIKREATRKRCLKRN